MAWDDGADWAMVPDHIAPGLRAYVEHGVPNGDFLTGVFENDLMKAAAYADETNIKRIGDIARFILWWAPTGCFGSIENVAAWTAQKGLE
jgi:hypothetical protein